MKKIYIYLFLFVFIVLPLSSKSNKDYTLHISFDTKQDILKDFLSRAKIYREAKPGQILKDPIKLRKMEIVKGKFGNALHIKDGWSITKTAANKSGADLDLIVATMWGDHRTKPHYWGIGKFYGDQGTIAFWIKPTKLIIDKLYPIFMQTSISWGRKERDLLRFDINKDKSLSVSIRDIFYQYHTVKSKPGIWKVGEWQHVAVVYNHAYGIKLYYNGKLVATNWGKDAWWDTPLPGLFSPFYPESYYDEIYFFNHPLSDNQIKELYKDNKVMERVENKKDLIDEAAVKRLLNTYANFDNLKLPELKTDGTPLFMKQAVVKDCHDEKIPAWWIMDGRYELAWPHPYLLFTYILGDVDWKGTKIDVDLEDGENPDYISMEGILSGIKIYRGNKKTSENLIINSGNYPYKFYSQKIDLKGEKNIHFDALKGYGTPPGLVDRGSLRFPLTGKTRIHEVQLWYTNHKNLNQKYDYTWFLSPLSDKNRIDEKYYDALIKLKGANDRISFMGEKFKTNLKTGFVRIAPLQSINFFSPDLNPDIPVDKVMVEFFVKPTKSKSILWIKFRDPANPSRLWAKSLLRVNFANKSKPQKIAILFDLVDFILASENRIWIDMKFSDGEKILFGRNYTPKIKVILSKDKNKAIETFSKYEMIPARMQYMKEYNYQPWNFTGEKRSKKWWSYFGGVTIDISNITTMREGIKYWTKFGGPYDMWYPPQSVIRINPDDEIAKIYRRLTGERAYNYGGTHEKIFKIYDKVEISKDIPKDAPAWAIWERELYKKTKRTLDWIISMQRSDGFFWGGSNDDTFIPMGFSAVPLMGDERARKSFLKVYDGLENYGIYKNGYCDVWPIDYLHITDFITSRGLMLLYALGDPHVVEREMITAKVYTDIMKKNNEERLKKGLKPFIRDKHSHNREPKLWGESLVRDYETTQLKWYWNEFPEFPPYKLDDKDKAGRIMMNISIKYDKTEEFDFTRAIRHTDKTGSMPGRQELIKYALGGTLPGRIDPTPHKLVVSWSDPSFDIARLVLYGSGNKVIANVYSFINKASKMRMRLWRINKGIYLVRVGYDKNDDGRIDSKNDVIMKKKMRLKRFSEIEFTIPPKKNIVINVSLIKKVKERKRLPDLAINRERDVNYKNGKLFVKVHNIGDAPVKNISVEIFDKNGRRIAAKIIPSIKAPIDFIPKYKVLEFDLVGKDWKFIKIDRKNKIEEIFEGNNIAIK